MQALTQVGSSNRAVLGMPLHRPAGSSAIDMMGMPMEFKRNAEMIYVLSGGFEECIVPVVAKLGIAPDHVLANGFRFYFFFADHHQRTDNRTDHIPQKAVGRYLENNTVILKYPFRFCYFTNIGFHLCI